MKSKYIFEQMELDGEIVAVPVGDNAQELHAMLRLNGTAADILKLLAEETTEEAIVEALLQKYSGDKTEITGYVRQYLQTLSDAGILA